MTAARKRLPNRRASTSFTLEVAGLKYVATISYFPGTNELPHQPSRRMPASEGHDPHNNLVAIAQRCVDGKPGAGYFSNHGPSTSGRRQRRSGTPRNHATLAGRVAIRNNFGAIGHACKPSLHS
jgi:hypothetical protein